ncbi:MAG: GNAT family N-acetyltransferase, partial [Candidatus Limnocylindrales bacterium]
MNDEDLVRLVDANLVEYGRFMARATPGGVAEEQGGALLVSGATPTPAIVNSAFMAAIAVDPAAMLPAAATFFRTRGHGYGIWTRGHADAALDAVLPAAGFEIALEMPVMVLDTMPGERPAPPGAVVGAVVDEATAADFRDVALDGFAEEEGVRSAVESKFGDLAGLREPEIAAYVARVDDRPVAAAMTFTALGVARVGWVGTLPAYRRRGLGAAVTRAALLGGFDRGARWAALESSAMGAPVYRALGFREVSR